MRLVMLSARVAYEARIAVWLADALGFALRPAAAALARRGYRVVWNVGDGVGHIVTELDNFLRAKQLGELEDRQYILLRRSSIYSRPVVELYGRSFHRAIASTFVYELALPLLIPRSELVHDAGMSRLKWQIGPEGRRVQPLARQSYLWQLSKEEQRESWREYYRRRRLTAGGHPLRQAALDNGIIERLLGARPKKLALIQVKRDRMNATGMPTDPQSYVLALERLRDEGYTLVLAGREAMPEELRDMFAADYAAWPSASFRNDLALFACADVAICGGSGLAWLPDCLGVPYLYLNSWHLAMQVYSPLCVVVPALASTRSLGPLTFAEQIELYENAPDAGAEVFPAHTHMARNASTEEIEAGLCELLELARDWRPRSEIQERYACLPNRAGLLADAEARVSERFLRAHADRFCESTRQPPAGGEGEVPARQSADSGQ
jgi:putative glycosyltransferase (TIGR04372 family)